MKRETVIIWWTVIYNACMFQAEYHQAEYYYIYGGIITVLNLHYLLIR